MDVPTITTGATATLTSVQRDADFLTITGHSITRQDFADTYAWGVDIDMDGHGFTTVRHVNGYVVYADQFLDGDDAAAIQAALLFLDNVGGGVLVVPPGSYDMDAGVELISNVWIRGLPGAVFQRTAGGTTLHGDDVSNVRISGIWFRGGATVSGAIHLEGAQKILVENNYFGDPSGNTQYHQGGCFHVEPGTVITTPREISVIDNIAMRESEFIRFTTCEDVEISRNHYQRPGWTSGGGGEWIVTGEDSANVVIQDNYIWNVPDGIAPRDCCIYLGGPNIANGVVNFTIRGNTAVGCDSASRKHVCLLDYCVMGTIEANDFWNAGGGMAGINSDCLHIENECKDLVIDNNILTSVGTANGGPTNITSRYGVYIDTDDCENIILKDNFLESVSDDTPNSVYYHGNPTIGGGPTGAGLHIAGANPTQVHRKGNVIIEDQQVRSTNIYDTGAGAIGWQQQAGVTVNGLRDPNTDALRAQQIDAITLTMEGTSGNWSAALDGDTNPSGSGSAWGDNMIGICGVAVNLASADAAHVRVHA